MATPLRLRHLRQEEVHHGHFDSHDVGDHIGSREALDAQRVHHQEVRIELVAGAGAVALHGVGGRPEGVVDGRIGLVPADGRSVGGNGCEHVGMHSTHLEQRLRDRKTGDGHAVRRAADVVDTARDEELGGLGVAGLLAADADLDGRVGVAGMLAGVADEAADTDLVERLERVALEQPVAQVLGDQLAAHVVATECEHQLGEVVRAEREEVADLGQLARHQRSAGSRASLRR